MVGPVSIQTNASALQDLKGICVKTVNVDSPAETEGNALGETNANALKVTKVTCVLSLFVNLTVEHMDPALSPTNVNAGKAGTDDIVTRDMEPV